MTESNKLEQPKCGNCLRLEWFDWPLKALVEKPVGPTPSSNRRWGQTDGLTPSSVFSYSRDGASCSQVRLLVRHHDVACAQGQGSKGQGGDYGPRWVSYLQAELIAAARVTIVHHRGLELIIAHTCQGRFAGEHCRIADDGQGSHRVALEHHLATGPLLDIHQRALHLTALEVLCVEREIGHHPSMHHAAAACHKTQGWIIDRQAGF